MVELKFFAPAKLQRAASPLILETTIVGIVATLRNTSVALIPNLPRHKHDERDE
jgi:hypothetical protein